MITHHIIELDIDPNLKHTDGFPPFIILKLFDHDELKLTFFAYKIDEIYSFPFLNFTPNHNETLEYLFTNKLVSLGLPKPYKTTYNGRICKIYNIILNSKLLLELL